MKKLSIQKYNANIGHQLVGVLSPTWQNSVLAGPEYWMLSKYSKIGLTFIYIVWMVKGKTYELTEKIEKYETTINQSNYR